MDEEAEMDRRRLVTPERHNYDGSRQSRSKTRSYPSGLNSRQLSLERKLELVRDLNYKLRRDQSRVRRELRKVRHERDEVLRTQNKGRYKENQLCYTISRSRSPVNLELDQEGCGQDRTRRERSRTRRERSRMRRELSRASRERSRPRRERSRPRHERGYTRRARSRSRQQRESSHRIRSRSRRERSGHDHDYGHQKRSVPNGDPSLQSKRLHSPTFSTNDVINLMASLKSQSSKVGTHLVIGGKNIVPEFDPSAKGQRIEIWLKKVNESATVYGWDDKTTIHFAMQKLQGLGKIWYEGLNTILYSWPEWQEKLKSAFPSDDNYSQSLENMLDRKSRPSEPIEAYYYDKLALLNQCEIEGYRAVDCIIHGLSDRITKSSALALRCSYPDQLLKFLVSNKNNSNFVSNTNKNSQGPTSLSNVFCYNCREQGHPYSMCTKPIKKCTKCNRVGHDAEQCKGNFVNNKD